MKKSKFTVEQIVYALKQAEAGVPVKELIRKYGVSDEMFSAWRKKYGGLDIAEMKRLKEYYSTGHLLHQDLRLRHQHALLARHLREKSHPKDAGRIKLNIRVPVGRLSGSGSGLMEEVWTCVDHGSVGAKLLVRKKDLYGTIPDLIPDKNGHNGPRVEPVIEWKFALADPAVGYTTAEVNRRNHDARCGSLRWRGRGHRSVGWLRS